MIKAEKGSVSMELDNECKDRSYIFGRLLAVAEVAEKVAMNNSADRSTNATRLHGVFVNRPFSTWENLRSDLNTYLQRMEPGRREYYENLFEEIHCLFREEDLKEMNKPLDAMYLLGYYHQRRELRNRKTSKEMMEDEK